MSLLLKSLLEVVLGVIELLLLLLGGQEALHDQVGVLVEVAHRDGDHGVDVSCARANGLILET